MQRQHPVAQEIPVLDRVNQQLLDHLATEKGRRSIPSHQRGTQCSIAGAVRRRSQTTRSSKEDN